VRYPVVFTSSLLVAGCVAGTESLECTTDFECGPNRLCVERTCSEPQDGGVSAPTDAGTNVPNDAGPNVPDDGGTITPPDASVPPYDGGTPGPFPFPQPPPHPECTMEGPVPCTCEDGDDGTQQCRSDGTFGRCICDDGERSRLERLRGGIVGLWGGTRTSVWDQTKPVYVLFLEDGTYGAQCNDACTAFYWGTDGPPTPARYYYLYDVTADDTGRGDLDLVWRNDDPRGQRYALERIELSEDEESLRFEFRRPDNNNPLHFDLRRVPR
jgi:hypothetical protein